MSEVVAKALALWGMEGAAHRLAAARENAVYEVQTGQSRYALRIHRQGYRSEAELQSELNWMAAACAGGISAPAPIRAKDGAYLHQIDGVSVDLLTWLSGTTLKDALPTLSPADRGTVFFDLGRDMARLHQVSDDWQPPPGFTRPRWDRDGLLGPAPLWDRFWENPDLADADRHLFETFRAAARARLDALEPSLDFGLIHADLVPDNVLVDGATLRMIDFDDGGFGYRLFDIATALLKHVAAADYPQLSARLIEGYHTVRPLDVSELDLFRALRAVTYVGWNITRQDEPGGPDRNRRFIATARNLVQAYLTKSVCRNT